VTDRWLRPLFVLLLMLSVALIACAETSSGTTQNPVDPTEVAQTETESTGSTETVVEVALPSGEEALAAAAGQPHVLWFWGAH